LVRLSFAFEQAHDLLVDGVDLGPDRHDTVNLGAEDHECNGYG
jgi:hypothetical protein